MGTSLPALESWEEGLVWLGTLVPQGETSTVEITLPAMLSTIQIFFNDNIIEKCVLIQHWRGAVIWFKNYGIPASDI